MCLKHTKVYEQVSSHGLACTDSRNTPKNTVFSKDAHAGVCAGLAIAAAPAFLERAVGEQQSIHYTDAAELRPSKISPPPKRSEKRRKLGYNTRNRNFKRLEPHFPYPATRSASKECTETAIALPNSQECIKEPMSSLATNGPTEKFGAGAQLRNILEDKLERCRCFQLSI